MKCDYNVVASKPATPTKHATDVIEFNAIFAWDEIWLKSSHAMTNHSCRRVTFFEKNRHFHDSTGDNWLYEKMHCFWLNFCLWHLFNLFYPSNSMPLTWTTLKKSPLDHFWARYWKNRHDFCMNFMSFDDMIMKAHMRPTITIQMAIV